MASDAFSFSVSATSGGARRGKLVTPHGEIETPIFMPVGTVGSVKGLAPDDLRAAQTQILLGNTYHLMLRPGAERLQRLGGLHSFMAWDGPILTDSGGFQVFSLGSGNRRGDGKKPRTPNPSFQAKVDDDGVTFRSHLDGSTHRMTPEESMHIQMCIGSDIIMALDQCPPANAERALIQQAMDRTTAWLARCQEAVDGDARGQRARLFGIVQGGVHADLRRQHAEEICSTGLFGYAVGGLSVGEQKEEMLPALEATTAQMPTDKPRYLMGVGTPDDLLEGVARGIDMFDCVMPTRNARTGTLFTSTGKVSIKRSEHAEDTGPLDEDCACYTCTQFSRAYLRHLFVANELLFFRLASLHNVSFYLSLMERARTAIAEDRYTSWMADTQRRWSR